MDRSKKRKKAHFLEMYCRSLNYIALNGDNKHNQKLVIEIWGATKAFQLEKEVEDSSGHAFYKTYRS